MKTCRGDHTFASLTVTGHRDRATARWMQENLHEPLPQFEDLDDLNKQIDAKKKGD
jgi:hypothetical protein